MALFSMTSMKKNLFCDLWKNENSVMLDIKGSVMDDPSTGYQKIFFITRIIYLLNSYAGGTVQKWFKYRQISHIASVFNTMTMKASDFQQFFFLK